MWCFFFQAVFSRYYKNNYGKLNYIGIFESYFPLIFLKGFVLLVSLMGLWLIMRLK